ncbi:MAG: cell division protein FtsA [Firmicutes bacterium]|nr:cell division protein FtsA [Bacillota bacterium]
MAESAIAGLSGDTDLVYALDIGTRKVAGVLAGVTLKGGFDLVAAEVVEHETRAMQDGQIHDVPSVARVIREVTDRLEQRCHVKLERVAVAAAGRALRTRTGTAARRISPLNRIFEDDVLALELEAVMSAQRSLVRDEIRPAPLCDRYFCVGYSVGRYELDGNSIGSLIGQRGEVIGVQAIATFLPRVVVDSLFTAIEMAGLEIRSMTLEPIAAIAVAIPSTMRQLNLALVDIGAGTSDIAITANGEVVAYGMVPIAGDEITEELCQRFLLDFHEGERVKRLAGGGGPIEYTDALGLPGQTHSEKVLEAIDAKVDLLAQGIADKILELNKSETQAVICIGGGSLTPGLPLKLAARLGMSPGRVAVRGREIVRNVSGADEVLDGPMAVTPLGIAVTAKQRNSLAFFSVKVNGHTTRLMHLGSPTVADAIIAAGVGIRQLHGKPGPGMTVEVNGTVHVIKGSPGKPAEVFVNGEKASLDAAVREGDDIRIEPPADGEPPVVTVGDLIDCEEVPFTFRGEQAAVLPKITRDGQAIDRDTVLNDADRIAVEYDRTVASVVCELCSDEDEAYRCISYRLNGRSCTAQVSRRRYIANGVVVSGDYRIRPGDVIDIDIQEIPLAVSDVFSRGRDEALKEVRILLNGREVLLHDGRSKAEVIVNGEPSGFDHLIADGDEIEVRVPDPPSFIVAGLLEHLNLGQTVDQLRASGRGSVKLLVNGKPATFSAEVRDGDAVDITFD